MDTLTIIAIETDAGYFIQEKTTSSYRNVSGLETYLFDGEKPTKTFHPHWVKIPNKPLKIEIKVPQSPINHRYELIDKALQSEKIPLVFKRDEVAYYEEYEWKWKSEYLHLSSLYREVSDPQPNLLENIQFTFNVLLKVDKVKEYASFSYPSLQKCSFSETNRPVSEVIHQEIDKILFPDIILPSKPSKLSAYHTYAIIREHVKTNINPKVARITSDYDFCFSVKKIIPLAEPYSYECSPIFGTKKERSKKVQKYVTDREWEVFEMCHEPYQKYTPVTPFRGESHEDLKKNIDNFLKELMERINEPVVECKACCGRGVILNPSLVK